MEWPWCGAYCSIPLYLFCKLSETYDVPYIVLCDFNEYIFAKLQLVTLQLVHIPIYYTHQITYYFFILSHYESKIGTFRPVSSKRSRLSIYIRQHTIQDVVPEVSLYSTYQLFVNLLLWRKRGALKNTSLILPATDCRYFFY